ncbi:cytochrome P450 [Trametes polyzona]|nr:cytochrome P450 [Trametes polyzona]
MATFMTSLNAPETSPWLLVLGVVVAFSILLRAYRARSKKTLPLPPGPRPLPLLGNIFDFPKKHLGPEFHKLPQKYGEVVSLKALGLSIILLDTHEAACGLLEKRSANYSHRPHLVMVDMTELDWIFVFQNYTPRRRKYRRALQQSFVSEAIARYYPAQLQTTRNLLRGLLSTPADFSAHIKFSFAATILRIVYGLDVSPGDKEHYTLVERLATVTNDIATPWQFLVETFPSLQRHPSWFPGAGFKRVAAVWREESLSIRDKLYASAKEAMVSAPSSGSLSEAVIGDRSVDGACPRGDNRAHAG